VFHSSCRHDVQTTAAIQSLSATGSAARSSHYCRQTGVPSIWSYTMEQFTTSRHISTVSRDLQAASQDITRTPADPPCCALSTRTLYCTQKYSLITFAVRLSSAILETKLIPVLSSQPAGNRSHKPSGRLPLLSARPAVTSRAAEHKIQ